MSETGDSVAPPGATIHVEVDRTVVQGEGDQVLAPSSPIPPEHYVDKSNDPKLPTAGELRRLGYVVDADVPDDAAVSKYAADAHLAPPAPVQEGTGDQLAAPGTTLAAEEYGYEPPPETSHPQHEEVQAALEREKELKVEEGLHPEESAEFREGAAAAEVGDDRLSPYDGRTVKGKDWLRGYDSVK